MNVQGLAAALSNRECARLGAVEIYFASLFSQAHQKATAYLDRRECGVVHDLIDFVWILSVCGENGNADLVYDEAWGTRQRNDVELWVHGAALLGQDLRVLDEGWSRLYERRPTNS